MDKEICMGAEATPITTLPK